MDKKTINLLYILTKPDLGGVAKYLLELTTHLPDNVKPYYIMSNEGYFSEELRKIGISNEQIFFVPMTNNIFNIITHIKSVIKTKNIIKQIRADLIHCNSTTGSIVGAVCSTINKIPAIYTVHGWPFTTGITKWKQVFYKILEYLKCRAYNKIICVSKYDEQIGIEALPIYKDKIITIHNGISDISDEYKKTEFSENELKIVMISRFCPQKDPYTLISAVSELNKEGFNIKLDLFGYGEETDKVINCIKSQNNSNIQYKGEISDVTPILRNYDVYALISNWEGLPIGILEGMRAGLPVLVSNTGGNSECVNNNGYLVKRKDIADCIKQIKTLWENRQNISTLSQNSRKFYEENFFIEKMITETTKEYDL